MKIDYAKKYKNTLDEIMNQVYDIMLAYNDKSQSQAQYTIIPRSKDGKRYLRFDAINNSTNELTSIFFSNQTIGVRLFDSEQNYKCYYTVSRKDDVQQIQVDYADGTGIEQSFIMDPNTKKYQLVSAIEMIPANDIVDLYDYTDEIIDESLILCCIYQRVNDNNRIRFSTSYSTAELLADSCTYYDFTEHPELRSMSLSLTKYSMEFVNNYLNAEIALEPSKFYTVTGKFLLTFSKMLNKMKEQQNQQNSIEQDNENR